MTDTDDKLQAVTAALCFCVPMSKPEATLDCLTCGACCFQRAGTILVTDADLDRWRRRGQLNIIRELEPGHFGHQAFKMSERGCCVFHGTEEHPHACAIYEDRADVCRDFERGCAQCHEFRRDRGIE